MRLVECVDDRLEHIADLRPDVDHGKRHSVALGQAARQVCLVGRGGPRAVVTGGEGVRDSFRLTGRDASDARHDGGRVQAARQKRRDGNIAH